MLPFKSLCYPVIIGNAVMLVSFSIQEENALMHGAEALLPRHKSSSLPCQRPTPVVAPIGEQVATLLSTEVAIGATIQVVTPSTLEVLRAAALEVVTPIMLDVSTIAAVKVFSERPLDMGPPIPWKTKDVATIKDVSVLPTAVAPPVTVVSLWKSSQRCGYSTLRLPWLHLVDATLVESEHCE